MERRKKKSTGVKIHGRVINGKSKKKGRKGRFLVLNIISVFLSTMALPKFRVLSNKWKGKIVITIAW
ncbi:MAG: hypothetical protein DRN11_02515 [Thermoplasmata archaeon]|nr:MAG: hypothetical protein DRN11_02515 [Thermoplasmata archaeon]